MWGIVSFGGYLNLVFKLDSRWNSKGLGRLVGRLDRGISWGKGEVFVVDYKVFVDWIGYGKLFKTLRTYV